MSRLLTSANAPYVTGSPLLAVAMQATSELENVSGTGTITEIDDGPATDYPDEMANYPKAIKFATTDGALFRKRNILSTPLAPFAGCMTHWIRIPDDQDELEINYNQTFTWPFPFASAGNYQNNIDIDGAGVIKAYKGKWYARTFSIRAAAASAPAPDYPPQSPLAAIYTGLSSVSGTDPVALDLGPIFANVRQRPKVMIAFDGCDDSIYDHVFPVMQAQGFVGTIYVIDADIGGSGMMTLAQIEELRTAGWSICMSIAQSPGNYTEAELTAEVKRIRGFASEKGWNNGHISWHGNRYDAHSRQIVENTPGLYTGRTKEVADAQWDPMFNLRHPFVPADDIDETASNLLADIDSSIECGCCRFLWGFGTAGAAGSDFMADSEFESLCASLKSRQQDGLCDVLSMEGYQRASLGLRAAA